ncbi:hypothetical protein CYMTET_6022 [Cymbomonas tetramitiformis]|uniref:Uncharacterized protein n=1 Tax=Cymbomonas tetramitiformis TaxID=36881 RepID=A0AAE0GY34_9CHLO|nr:hypothetical protein CYMTET_6022 [Cymbomonas tetramitiformis]
MAFRKRYFAYESGLELFEECSPFKDERLRISSDVLEEAKTLISNWEDGSETNYASESESPKTVASDYQDTGIYLRSGSGTSPATRNDVKADQTGSRARLHKRVDCRQLQWNQFLNAFQHSCGVTSRAASNKIVRATKAATRAHKERVASLHALVLSVKSLVAEMGDAAKIEDPELNDVLQAVLQNEQGTDAATLCQLEFLEEELSFMKEMALEEMKALQEDARQLCRRLKTARQQIECAAACADEKSEALLCSHRRLSERVPDFATGSHVAVLEHALARPLPLQRRGELSSAVKQWRLELDLICEHFSECVHHTMLCLPYKFQEAGDVQAAIADATGLLERFDLLSKEIEVQQGMVAAVHPVLLLECRRQELLEQVRDFESLANSPGRFRSSSSTSVQHLKEERFRKNAVKKYKTLGAQLLSALENFYNLTGRRMCSSDGKDGRDIKRDIEEDLEQIDSRQGLLHLNLASMFKKSKYHFHQLYLTQSVHNAECK